MSIVFVSNCMSDTKNNMMRSNYVKVHKWPEFDAELAKAEDISDMQTPPGESGELPRIVDNVSCRQMYLRSYQFSKKETVPERTKKCLGKFRQRMVLEKKKTGDRIRSCKGKDKVKMKKSVPAFRAMFKKMLSCTTSLHVMG